MGWLREDWGENAEVQLAHDLSDMSGRPQREMSSSRRIRGSKLIGEVIATETNLEVISLRIFKSMGTGEITQEEGSRERRRNPGPNPEEPRNLARLRSWGSGALGVSGTMMSPAPEGTGLPLDPCPLGECRGQLVWQEEKKGVGRSRERNMLEARSGLPGGLPLSRKWRTKGAIGFGRTEVAVTTDEGPSCGAGRYWSGCGDR